jgi:hypothetical protein
LFDGAGERKKRRLIRGSGGRFSMLQCSAVAVFALLVGKAAGGLASRLAGSLALAAAAGLQALGQITSFQGLDSLHQEQLLSKGPVSGRSVIYDRTTL